MTNLRTLHRAGLGLALATVGLGGLAQAAPERVQFGDLDLATAAGAAALHARIDVAAHRFCADADERDLSSMHNCRQAVADEVLDQLSSRQRQALVAAATAKQPLRVAAVTSR